MYTLNETTLKTLIKLHLTGETQPMVARDMCSIWVVVFLLSAHTKLIYPTHFADSPYVRMTNYSYLMLTNFIGSSYRKDFVAKNVTYKELCYGCCVRVVV